MTLHVNYYSSDKNKYQMWNAYLIANQADHEHVHVTLSDMNKATPRLKAGLKVTRLREVLEKRGKVNKLPYKGRQTILATHVVQCRND